MVDQGPGPSGGARRSVHTLATGAARPDGGSGYERYLRSWSAPVDVTGRVVVACSGGADSLALLVLAAARGLDVVAVHVDHAARAGSAREAEAVATAARRVGAGVVAVSAPAEPGPAFEARARTARYAALEAVRRAEGASAILVAHTADDQAETVLLNLLRGAGRRGLGGMPRVRGHVVRPILDLGRADTLEICARAGLVPLLDPMNEDRAFRRVWLRREVIPMLEAGAERDLRRLLAAQADVLRDESDFLDGLAAHELALATEPGGAGSPRLTASAIAALPSALARRAVRAWITAPGAAPPSSRDVAAVLGVVRGETAAAQLAGGRRVERSAGSLHLAGPERTQRSRPPVDGPVELEIPGTTEVGALHLETWVERAAPVAWPDGRWTCVMDADAVGASAIVRPAIAGERFHPLGAPGRRKLSTVLAEEGVPVSERSGYPVLAGPAGTPLWVLGYRVGSPGRVTASTRRYLWIRATQVGSAARAQTEHGGGGGAS